MEYPTSEPMDTLCNDIQNQMEFEDSNPHLHKIPLPTSSYDSAKIHTSSQKDSIPISKFDSSVEAFQKMFALPDDSIHQTDSPVFRSPNPWDEDISYKSDHFIPFLTKPKKLKLTKHGISKQNSTHSNTLIQQKPRITKLNEKQKSDTSSNVDGLSQSRTREIFAKPSKPSILNTQQTSNTQQTRPLSILERARRKLDKRYVSPEPVVRKTEPKSPGTSSKPQLYPGYNPDEGAKRKARMKECSGGGAGKKEYPKPDPTKPENYNMSRIRLLTEQLYSLIDDENDNRKKVQEIQSFCKNKWPNSDKLHKDVDSAVESSNAVIDECVRAVRGTGRIEEHCAVIARVLKELENVKQDDNDSS